MITHVVGAGSQAVARAPDLLRAPGVGSCVVVSLWDAERRIGGLAHVPLPEHPRGSEPAERYVDSGLELLLERLRACGCHLERLEAKAAGGATLLVSREEVGATSIAKRNLNALELTLDRIGVRLASEDLGGEVARSVELDTRTGALRVTSVRSATSIL